MKALVKDIYIKLPGYVFWDSPYPGLAKGKGKDKKYMARPDVEGQLKARLRNGNRSGTILISGYRGVGKTSVVRKVFSDLDKEHAHTGRKYIPVELNLAQDELDVRTILRLMATELLRAFQDMEKKPSADPDRSVWYKAVGLGFICFLVTFLVASAAVSVLSKSAHPLRLWPFDQYPPQTAQWISLLAVTLLPLLAGSAVAIFYRRGVYRENSHLMGRSMRVLQERLRELIDRIRSEVSTDDMHGVSPSSSFPFSFSKRRHAVFPMASVKEIEQELIDILSRFSALDRDSKGIAEDPVDPIIYRQIVFVVDELDKLVPRGFRSIWDKEREDPTDDGGPGATQPGLGDRGSSLYRERQEAVADLFANLKHFLNVAEAKFIFIGGHDLYEGVLADTSNRDPFFGSIYNQVIPVPSLLKQKQEDGDLDVVGLTATTERFLTRTMLGDYDYPITLDFHDLMSGTPEGPEVDPNQGVHHINELNGADRLHVYLALINLCMYLTFRSNGSVKKLIQLFERPIVELDGDQVRKLKGAGHLIFAPSSMSARSEGERQICIDCKERRCSNYPKCKGKDGQNVCQVCTPCERCKEIADWKARKSKTGNSSVSSVERALYLRLGGNDQYAHAFITYLYRNFLSQSSRFFSTLNDKNLVSFTYLMDHLLKYNSTAFSFSHLQLLPEALAVDKIPGFHKFINDVVDQLSVNIVRRIDNGLFGFQFYTRIYNEVALLSKVSDLDSAAMNFSLDESLPVKQHMYRRLNQMKLQQASQRGEMGDSSMARSSVHHSLGDIHFFDAQWDDALGQYRSASALLRPDKGMSSTAAYGTRIFASSQRPDLDQFSQYVKLRLKEVLCLEKMKVMELALATTMQLSGEVLAYLRQWDASDNSDVSNWRSLVMAFLQRCALTEKISRRSLNGNDLRDLFTFISELQRRAGNERVPMLSVIRYYLGTILFYSGRGITDAEDLLKCNNARMAYLHAIDHLLSLDTKASPITGVEHMKWISACHGSLAEQNHAKQDLAGVILSKYADAIVAEGGIQRGFILTLDGGPFQEGKWLISQDGFGVQVGYLLLAASAFHSCGSHFRAVFQVMKVLTYLIETMDRTRVLPIKVDFVTHINALSDWAIRTIQVYQRNLDEHQIARAKEDLELKNITNEDRVALASYASETLDVMILRDELFLKLDLIKPDEVIKRHRSLTGIATLRFTKARQLMLCIRTNWMSLPSDILGYYGMTSSSTTTVGGTKGSHSSGNTTSREGKLDLLKAALVTSVMTPEDKLLELITDSLFCSFELLDITRLYGPGFIGNNTINGKASEHLGDWCLLLENLEEVHQSTIKRELKRLLGAKCEHRLSSLMHYSVAMSSYEQAYSVHERGKAYRRLMNDMYLLEDDHTDNLYHFCHAMERIFIKHEGKRGYKKTKERLEKRIAVLQETKVYKFSN